MKSLKTHCIDEFQVTFDIGAAHLAQTRYNGLEQLLSTCFVVKNARLLKMPQIPLFQEHKSAVDKCIVFLLDNQLFDNVLTYGYSIGRNNHVDTALHCEAINTQVAKIKSPRWQILHEFVGTRNFVDLLINCTIIEYNGSFFTQIVGNRLNKPNYPPPWCMKSSLSETESMLLTDPITVRSILYRHSSEMKQFNILGIGTDVKKLFELIFDADDILVCKKIKSKAFTLLSTLIDNHKKKVNYTKILDNICPRIDSMVTKSNLDHQTPLLQVHRLLIVITEKLIPPEMFGSKRNKSIVFTNLLSMLQLTVTGSIEFQQLIQKLNLKDFLWLRVSKVHFSRNDFLISSKLMSFFISWLFRVLFPRIIKAFFYCTDSSTSSGEIMFFRHDVWNALSGPFLSNYFEKYLFENCSCRNHNSFLLSSYNHVRFRVVPKLSKDEFRLITIPHKGADEEEYVAFKDNTKRHIMPTQCILEYLRNKRNTFFKKIYSVNEISSHIKEFRNTLLRKHGNIPSLYYMKFDIDSCYDSIPREKALQILRDLLCNENGFIVRSQTIFNPDNDTTKIINVVNGNRKPVEGEVYIDNVRTAFFTNDDVLKIVEMELFKTSLIYDGKCYLRRSGLFQGTSLSALLVDIIYDDLLLNNEIFHQYGKEGSTIIRLADDFLFVTIERQRILKMKKAVKQGFEEYNAKVKMKKVVCISDATHNRSIEFCGLIISTHRLEIWKSNETLKIPAIHSASSRKVHTRLLRYFEMKLSYGTTDLDLNQFRTAIFQIKKISKATAEAYVTSFRHSSIDNSLFPIFFDRLYDVTIESCLQTINSTNKHHMLSKIICITIAKCFLRELLPYQTRFKPIQNFLRKKILDKTKT